MKILITVILFLFTKFLYCQEVYLHVVPGKIFRLETDYSLTLITQEIYSTTINGLGDIALAPDGSMYGISTSGQLILINLNDGQTQIISDFPTGEFYNTLTCNSNYELFTLTSEGNLYKYNILNNTTELISNINMSSPGDLTFYKGHLIFQSNGHIRAYNFETNSVKTILCREDPLPVTVGLWGIANLFSNCDSEYIYASDNASNLYHLNIENGYIEHLFYYYDFSYPQAYDILGMTSTNEYLASECTGYTLNDIDCNELGISEYDSDFKSIIYPNPSKDKIFFNHNVQIDKTILFSAQGEKIIELDGDISEMDVSKYNSGLFFLRILDINQRISIIKLIVN